MIEIRGNPRLTIISLIFNLSVNIRSNEKYYMKILIIENNLAGGVAEKVLLTLLENLRPPKYDITLLLIKNKGLYLNDVPSYIKVQYMIDVTQGEKEFPKDSDTLIEFYEKRIDCDYDVEIAFLEGPPTKLLAHSNNHRSRKIAWVHIDLEKVHWTYSYFRSINEEKTCYLKMDHVVFVSENAQKGFENLFRTKLKNALVINNPINTTRIKTLAEINPIQYSSFTCVVVGSLVNRKGQSRLLYSMGRLFQLGYRFHLYLIGEGNEKNSLKELSHILNISKYVHFTGFQRNPYSYMKNANLLISSSITEGYPLVSCEALCLGLPILATNCSGNRDVLQNGKYGLLVENTEEGIFYGLKSILDSPQLYENLKEKAHLGFVECQFETRLNQIEHLLEGI